MSENPRKRQLENELPIRGNEGTSQEDGDDDDNIDDEEIDEYDEDEIHQNESQNNCNTNTVDNINVDDEKDMTEINDDDDDDDDDSFNNDCPWVVCDEYDENVDFDHDYDDCHLQRAIKEEHPINTILELIQVFPIQVRHKNELGEYPLHTACSSSRHGIDYVIMKLIQLYPEATRHKNSSGLYPVHVSFRADQSDAVVMKLIDIFPKPVSKPSTDGNVLHFVCDNSNVSETLIRKLIDINPKAIEEQDNDWCYPIYYAIIRQQSIAVIVLLLDGDPLGTQRRCQGEDNEETIFRLACNRDYADLVKYLMQRSDFQINAKDSSGRTPLHDACKFRRYPNEDRDKILDMILNHQDVDVNATDSLNDTPLHKTLKEYDHDRNPEKLLYVIQKLLEHSFILINEKNNDNKTPLDLIQDHVNILEKYNELTPWQQHELSCFMKIIHFFKEFPVKRRWQGYCYHVKNFIDCDDSSTISH